MLARCTRRTLARRLREMDDTPQAAAALQAQWPHARLV